MYLLISTTRFLLGCDVPTGKVDVLAGGSRFYGVTWSPSGETLALTHFGYDAEIASLADYAAADRGYVSVGARRSWPFLNSPHQALWIDEHRLAVTNTGRNAVACLDVRDMAVVQRRYDDAIWDRFDPSGADGCHYNSAFFDGGAVYFVAHNFSRTSFVVKAAWPSLELLERVPMVGVAGVHNLWIDDDGRWLTCDSYGGALVNARTGERLWDSRGEGYARGLAAAPEQVFVGCSEVSPRGERELTASGVWVLDRGSLMLRDYLHLGHFGAVQEVRVIDVPDACHHGLPLLTSALDCLAVPREAVIHRRLARGRLALPDAREWRARLGGFALEGTWLVGKPAALSLATRTDAVDLRDASVSARLRWRGADSREDHADLVLRYSGPLDQRMYAAILQVRDGALVASIYLEDAGWHALGATTVRAEHLEALRAGPQGLAVGFEAYGTRLRLFAGGDEILVVDDATLTQGDAGLRTLGDTLAVGEFHVTGA
jgi:hypothetical protein